LTDNAYRPGGTNISTFQALIAFSPVNLPPLRSNSDGILRASLSTLTTLNTLYITGYDLGEGLLRFRVAAPAATQGTALKKHSSSDARAILNGEPLDIEYQPFLLVLVLSVHALLNTSRVMSVTNNTTLFANWRLYLLP
jgi:hypothetical protein